MREASKRKRSWLTAVVTTIFALVFSAELYLFAATASIYDSYQPGISGVRMFLHPLALLLILAGAPLFLGLVWRAHRSALAELSESISLVGGVICLLALALLLALDAIGVRCDDPLPAIRELRTTLQHSLGCPNFSGRSGASAVYGGLLSAFLFWGSRRLRRAA